MNTVQFLTYIDILRSSFIAINPSLYIEEPTFADWLEEASFRTNAGVERRLEGVGSDA